MLGSHNASESEQNNAISSWSSLLDKIPSFAMVGGILARKDSVCHPVVLTSDLSNAILLPIPVVLSVIPLSFPFTVPPIANTVIMGALKDNAKYEIEMSRHNRYYIKLLVRDIGFPDNETSSFLSTEIVVKAFKRVPDEGQAHLRTLIRHPTAVPSLSHLEKGSILCLVDLVEWKVRRVDSRRQMWLERGSNPAQAVKVHTSEEGVAFEFVGARMSETVGNVTNQTGKGRSA
jgi:hypothetical protein